MDTRYQVINQNTGNVIASRKTRKAARKLADRLDNEYGAYVHYVRSTESFLQEAR